jgi:signal transduction histidine kinase
MERAFVNILKSATEAIGEDGSITVWFDRQDARLRVAIQDTGRALTDEVRAGLFTPSSRPRKTDTASVSPSSRRS